MDGGWDDDDVNQIINEGKKKEQAFIDYHKHTCKKRSYSNS